MTNFAKLNDFFHYGKTIYHGGRAVIQLLNTRRLLSAGDFVSNSLIFSRNIEINSILAKSHILPYNTHNDRTRFLLHIVDPICMWIVLYTTVFMQIIFQYIQAVPIHPTPHCTQPKHVSVTNSTERFKFLSEDQQTYQSLPRSICH